MSINPVTFNIDIDIYEAIHLLLQRNLSGATVINANNEVVGVLSEMDCLKAIVNVGYYHEGGGKVSDFMTKGSVETIEKHLSLIDAAQKLISTGHRRLPVVVEGKFSGQISARSLLQAFKDSMTQHDITEDEAYV